MVVRAPRGPREAIVAVLRQGHSTRRNHCIYGIENSGWQLDACGGYGCLEVVASSGSDDHRRESGLV